MNLRNLPSLDFKENFAREQEIDAMNRRLIGTDMYDPKRESISGVVPHKRIDPYLDVKPTY